MIQAQHQQYGGKCGICGDAYGSEQPEHAYPGKFATGILGRSYFTPGQVWKVSKLHVTNQSQCNMYTNSSL